LRKGEIAGRHSGELHGSELGKRAGVADASDALAAAEAKAAAQSTPALEYTDQLPSGQPGYVLPPDQRSLGCVGYDADTGQCVGD